MSQFVVEFSPPVKIKSKEEDTQPVLKYCLVLAPFQKQTQVEFSNIRIKETAVRFLTLVNPLDKYRKIVLPPSSDGILFDVYEFTLQPNSQREISITWQPSISGNMRKLIKIEEVDSNKKYDFVVLGNCVDPINNQFKSTKVTYSKSKNSNYIKKQINCGQKKITLNKTKVINCKSEISERILVGKQTSNLICSDTLKSPIRRQTFSIEEKENLPHLKKKIFNHDAIISDSDYSCKRSDKNHQDFFFNKHFNIQDEKINCDLMSDDSLDGSLKKIVRENSLFNDICLTPLKSTENFISPFGTTMTCNKFNKSYQDLNLPSFNPSPFKPIEASTAAKTYTPEERKSNKVTVNLCDMFEQMPDNDNNKANTTFIKETVKFNSESILSPLKVEQSFDLKHDQGLTSLHTPINKSKIRLSIKTPKRPSFSIKNSPFYKFSPKSTLLLKNKFKPYSPLSPRKKHLRTPKQDKCDQYLKCLANPELVHHQNAEDPFLKMSKYYASEWLDRQESDMIRWLNALLMPTDELADEDQSGDLEQAATAWVEASKTNHKNKPIQLATQKDLFAAQIYRQSPQQWSALRKATINLITSTSVASVLSKLSVSIEKDLITVRDDRQIHLDLNLKKKITDLLKCYNPLWLRTGLEAIYGQIILVKPGSSDLDGLGWFIRKNLFNNNYIKQKFTKTNILQVNLPLYNIAMKKFILRKILMLIYFLDRAKEQKIIRHNPCLFKIDSPYKSSYDFLMGFCADMVTAHGDIMRRMRNIDYNLTHKQTHLDEVNYAVNSLNDLRDGIRLTRVVEILFKGNQLSPKLRLPAISKLQKIHNVNLALTRISEHITIEGNISSRDIVNGHREKMLSLFWQLIYKYLTPKYNTAAIKIQQWWQKNSIKLVILKRIRAKQNLKRHLAAVKIQACVRGYLVRKQWRHMQAELIENRKKLHLASTTIKRYLQNKLKLLTEERKQFVILRRTVVFIQRKYKSKLAMKKDRQNYMKLKQSALLIQKVYRGFAVRKNWLHIKNSLVTKKIKRINAINIIKRSLRRNLPPTKDKLYYEKLIFATLIIQRKFRAINLMKIQMNEFFTLKRSVIVVQRRFKAKQAMINQREHYLKLKICTLKLQTAMRGYLVRKQWPALRNKLHTNKMHLITSSNIIKKALRKNLPLTEDRIKFLEMKRSVIVLQRRFRAMKAMQLQRKQYLQLKICVLKLQSLIRGYLLRSQWPSLKSQLLNRRLHLNNCSNIIKKILRKNLPVTKDRMEFIELRTAAVVLQRRFRAMKAMHEDRDKYIKIKLNVIKLQSTVRGYIVRKQWPTLRIELQANKIHLINCSNIIKRALRRNLPSSDDYFKFIQLKKSIIIIQRRFRAMQNMKQQRKHYLQLKTATLKLQSVARGYILRKKWPHIQNELIVNRQRLINSSNVIKRVLRKNLPATEDHLRFLELRKTAISIQCRFKANIQKKKYQKLRDNVILIQRKFRANLAMKHQKDKYESTKTMTIKLQGYIRGYLTRKRWPETKCELQLHQRRLITASNTVKRFLRQCLPPSKERINYLELRQSVINMQARYRASVAMKLTEREYLLIKQCVVILQRYYRAHRAMVTQKQHYMCLKKSAIIIQANFRGYLARKQWPQLKNNLETFKKHKTETWKCKELLAGHAFLIELNMEMRAAVQLQNLTRNVLLIRKHLQKKNVAAVKIQAAIRGFLVRKNLPKLKYELHIQKQTHAATIIQSLWRGYCVRKRYQCNRQTILIPKNGALTLGKRHNDVIDVFNKQKRNEYSYRELATVFWNLDTCTSLSKELCLKTAHGVLVDEIFHFLQYSNQSQPSIEAREPAIRVLTNLLKYHETSRHIWMRTVNSGMVKDLIKMMKTCCGKITTYKLFCSLATWLWIVMQDSERKHYIKNIPTAIIDLRFMMDTLNKKYRTHKVDKKKMVLPSTRPSWSIGFKCQKCFESDIFAMTQLCKLLNI